MENFFIVFILSVFVNFLMIFVYRNKIFKNYKSQVQDTHHGNIPRTGGLIILTLFTIFGLINKSIQINIILIGLFFLIPAFLDDFRLKINPLIRLSLTIIACFFVIKQIEILPIFEMGYLNIIFNNYNFKLIFFTIALTGLINGSNMIDGTNGLCGITFLFIFIGILIVGFFIKDTYLIHNSFLMIILLISFLLLNYPFGKIFLGDFGSYFLGFYSGYLIIDTFGRNPDLASWSAAVLLFYPTFEVLFSFTRKVISKKSPFQPDRKHLHLKLFFILSRGKLIDRPSNALVMPLLSIIWQLPLALFVISLIFGKYSFFLLLSLTAAYLCLYYILSRHTFEKQVNNTK